MCVLLYRYSSLFIRHTISVSNFLSWRNQPRHCDFTILDKTISHLERMCCGFYSRHVGIASHVGIVSMKKSQHKAAQNNTLSAVFRCEKRSTTLICMFGCGITIEYHHRRTCRRKSHILFKCQSVRVRRDSILDALDLIGFCLGQIDFSPEYASRVRGGNGEYSAIDSTTSERSANVFGVV